MHAKRPTVCRAFTLIEVMAVVIIMAILAATAAPALSSVSAARTGAAADEVARQLRAMRSRAMSTGEPSGLRIDPTANTLAPLRIASQGAAPDAAPSASGAAGQAELLSGRFAGVSLTSFVNGDGTSGAGVVWFSYLGEPQTRTLSGVTPRSFTTDAVITIGGSQRVTVRRLSGLIER